MSQKIKHFGKIEIFIGAALLAPVFTYVGFYMSCLFDPRFTLQEMDLNKDGFVSPGEADYVSSSGERKIVVNGKDCIEYYAYKTGLPVKSLCGRERL